MEAVQALTGWWSKATDVVAAGEKEVSSGSKWSASVQIFRNRRGESWGRSGGGSRGRESSGGRDAHDPRGYRQELDEIDVAEEEKHVWIGGRGWINRLEEGRKGKAPGRCAWTTRYLLDPLIERTRLCGKQINSVTVKKKGQML